MRTKISKLWGRITGADKRKQYPVQQGSTLSRVGDLSIVYPFGFYADAPQDQLYIHIADGVVMPVTVLRPDDSEQGEPVFFHPETNTRIIARNNGDLDILKGDGGDVNIVADTVNIDASTTNIGVGGDPIARLGDTVAITLEDPGESWDGAPGEGTITSGGGNTST